MTDIGYYTLYLAMGFSFFAIAGALAGARWKRPEFIVSAKNSVIIVFALLSVTSAALIHGLVSKDFLIKYVARYVSLDLPLAYRISSFYAGQAGSLLLWATSSAPGGLTGS